MVNSGLAAAFADTVIGSSDSSFGKYSAPKIGTYNYSLLVIAIGLLPTLVYFLLMGITGPISLGIILLSVVAGLFLAVGFVLYYEALKTQQISHAAVIGEIQPVILLLFGILVLGEVITVLEGVGALIIFLGAFMVMTTEKMKVNWGLLPILLANICWAFYWIVMAYAINGYGGIGLPILVARICGFIFLLAFALGGRKMEKNIKRPTTTYHKVVLGSVIVTSGIVDGFYNLIFGFIINVKIVAVAAALLAAGPLITLILGRIFFKDRLTLRQGMGFVLALVGAIMIAI